MDVCKNKGVIKICSKTIGTNVALSAARADNNLTVCLINLKKNKKTPR